jgi:hypothetical protein
MVLRSHQREHRRETLRPTGGQLSYPEITELTGEWKFVDAAATPQRPGRARLPQASHNERQPAPSLLVESEAKELRMRSQSSLRPARRTFPPVPPTRHGTSQIEAKALQGDPSSRGQCRGPVHQCGVPSPTRDWNRWRRLPVCPERARRRPHAGARTRPKRASGARDRTAVSQRSSAAARQVRADLPARRRRAQRCRLPGTRVRGGSTAG